VPATSDLQHKQQFFGDYGLVQVLCVTMNNSAWTVYAAITADNDVFPISVWPLRLYSFEQLVGGRKRERAPRTESCPFAQ
jgi:hypothetical protein